jgi:hypothetical protein
MHKPFLIYCLLLFSLNGNCQVYYNDSALVSGSSKYVINFYNKARHDFNPLYNGLVHYSYTNIDEGTPYFSGEKWYKGSVIYEDYIYDSVLMKYDLVKDQLIVVAEENNRMPLELFSPRVKEFSYAGLKFLFIPGNGELSLKEGFYQQLSNGKIMALCRTENTIEEVIVGDHLERKITQRKKYYIIDNNRLRTINRQQDLMDAVKKHRQQINDHLRAKKLKFKKNKQLIITAATDLYNKLESQNNE